MDFQHLTVSSSFLLQFFPSPAIFFSIAAISKSFSIFNLVISSKFSIISRFTGSFMVKVGKTFVYSFLSLFIVNLAYDAFVFGNLCPNNLSALSKSIPPSLYIVDLNHLLKLWLENNPIFLFSPIFLSNLHQSFNLLK